MEDPGMWIRRRNPWLIRTRSQELEEKLEQILTQVATEQPLPSAAEQNVIELDTLV